jgi:hypothetical protein
VIFPCGQINNFLSPVSEGASKSFFILWQKSRTSQSPFYPSPLHWPLKNIEREPRDVGISQPHIKIGSSTTIEKKKGRLNILSLLQPSWEEGRGLLKGSRK